MEDDSHERSRKRRERATERRRARQERVEESPPIDLDNPYAPPRAEPEPEAAPRVGRQRAVVFSVRPLKLAILSITTLGFYDLYWFYRNWQLALRNGESVSPIGRTLFSGIYAYSCFKRVRTYAGAAGLPSDLAAGPLAIAYVLLHVFGQLPGPLGLLALLGFLPVYAANNVARQINGTMNVGPEDDDNTFTAWNWICIAAGGALFVLALIR